MMIVAISYHGDLSAVRMGSISLSSNKYFNFITQSLFMMENQTVLSSLFPQVTDYRQNGFSVISVSLRNKFCCSHGL